MPRPGRRHTALTPVVVAALLAFGASATAGADGIAGAAEVAWAWLMVTP